MDKAMERSELISSIEILFEEASNHEEKFNNELRPASLSQVESEEFREATEELSEYIEIILEKTLLLADHMGLNASHSRIISKMKDCGSFGELSLFDQVDIQFSPHLRWLRRYFKDMLGINAASSFEFVRLRYLISRIPEMLEQKNIRPKKENEIKKAFFATARLFYADLQQEMNISKGFKTFRPDIGVTHLKAAIEFKFATDLRELNAACGGVYEDMRGYYNSSQWTTFYSVFCMTSLIRHQEELENEFKLVGADKNWTPIAVVLKPSP